MLVTRNQRINLAFGLLPCLAAFFLAGSVVAFEWYHADRIYPGVSVWGIALGGMRPEEAARALESGLAAEMPRLTLYGPGLSWSARVTDLGLRLHTQATIAAAYAVGRTSTFPDNIISHLDLLLSGVELSPVLVYDEQVARLYLETLAKQVELPPVDATLSFDGLTPVATEARAGRALDVDATLSALYPILTSLSPVGIRLTTREVQPAISNAEPGRAEAERILSGPLVLTLTTPLEGDPVPWVIPPEQLVTMLSVEARDGVLHIKLNEEPLRAFLNNLTATLAIEPVDARFHFNERTKRLEAISPSKEGRALDVEGSLAKIVQELMAGNHTVPLVVQPVPPRYPDTATAEELGIIELVAEGDSYFIGSPSGRDHNIRLAASKFDGLVIPPGEVFSFNHYLGEVSAAAGYDESYVTMGEQLAIEVGGGICQVSTTAFRAAFWGGYPILERWAHNHRVGYYELMGAGVGMDATIYSPLVDFRFLNDRPYPLLIETEIVEQAHRLIFRFYSTGDGRRVEKEGPEISDETAPGPPIYKLDEKLAPGTVKQWQKEVNGLTATIRRRVYSAAGDLLFEDTFVSKYAPRRALYYYGPGYVPPEEGEAAEESR